MMKGVLPRPSGLWEFPYGHLWTLIALRAFARSRVRASREVVSGQWFVVRGGVRG